MARQPIRIGARGSKLSLVQAETVRAAIAAKLGDDSAAELVRFTTAGDRIQDRALTEIGGKGLFTEEIEAALLAGSIDCAVHSLKDLPAASPEGLVIGATPEREDPRDAFVSGRFGSLAALPAGGRLGTASLRRQAQALRQRPDLQVTMLRGNVDTRLAKLDRGDAEALLLAAAGLRRLGFAGRITALIDPFDAPPAPGQGALAVQVRKADEDASWLTSLDHRPTRLATTAERAALAALDGSCRTAIGAYAVVDGGQLTLLVEALSSDGSERFRSRGQIAVSGVDSERRAATLGATLGSEVRAQAGDILAGEV